MLCFVNFPRAALLVLIASVLASVGQTREVDPNSDDDDSIENPIEEEPATKGATFEIMSLKNCDDSSKDAVNINDIQFPREVKFPGNIKVNGTFQVKDKLPSKWNIDVRLKVKIPIAETWLTIPCVKSCKLKNVCNETFVQKCADRLKALETPSSEIAKVCRCDLDQGTYSIPAFEIPVKLSKRRERISKQMRGRQMMIQATFRSSDNGSRFACFSAIVKRSKRS